MGDPENGSPAPAVAGASSPQPQPAAEQQEFPQPSSIYVIIDTESGGFDPRTTALLQVSMIVVDKDLNELDTFAHRIIPNPDYGIDEGAVKVNGYNEAEWLRTGMSYLHADTAYSQFLSQWFGNPNDPTTPVRKAVGVAHYAIHDEKFVRHHLPKTYGMILDPWFCTCKALQKWRKRTGNEGNAKLASLAALAGYVHQGADRAHDALGDTKACLAGLRWLRGQPG